MNLLFVYLKNLMLSDIGSDKCDGNTGQKIPCCNTKFLFTGNMTSGLPYDYWQDPEVKIIPDPKFVASFDRNKMRPEHIKYPDRKPTICDKKLRTINTHAECGSPEVRSSLIRYPLPVTPPYVLVPPPCRSCR